MTLLVDTFVVHLLCVNHGCHVFNALGNRQAFANPNTVSNPGTW